MKHTPKMTKLLKRLRSIEEMERGKLCQMAGRPHFNHQTWRNGANQVRYVPKDQLAALRRAIAGYQRFCELAEAYADEIIAKTRAARQRAAKKPSKTAP